MKKLLFILFAVIAFASCTEHTVKKADLPIEVVQLKDINKFDTIYQIETDKKVYQFNNSKEYVGKYDKQIDNGPLVFLAIGFFVVVMFLLIVLLFL